MTYRSTYFLIIGYTFVLLCESCVTPKYVPARQAIPVLEAKKDLHVDVSGSIISPLFSQFTRGNPSTLNLSSTYAISHSIGVHVLTSNTIDTLDNRRQVGIGFGYFNKTGEKSNFQIFLNGTKGKVNSWDLNSINDIEVNYVADTYSISLQPQFTYRTNKEFSITLLSTLKRISFIDVLRDDIPMDNRHDILLEPAFSVNYRIFDNWRITTEIGTSVKLQGEFLPFGYYSVGLGYCITCNNEVEEVTPSISGYYK